MRIWKAIAVACCLPTIAGVALAADPDDTSDRWSLRSGVDSSTGTYGTSEPTDILSESLTLKYETDTVAASLTVPYVTVTSTGAVLPGGTRLATSRKATTQRTTEAGLGDVLASLGFTAITGSSTAPSLDVTGIVKFGTADRNKGLGTGENDYSLESSLYGGTGLIAWFAIAGYDVLGSPPGEHLRDVWYGTLGLEYGPGESGRVGAMWDGREPASASSGPVNEGTLYARYRAARVWSFQLYVLRGFATGSPTSGVGFSVTARF